MGGTLTHEHLFIAGDGGYCDHGDELAETSPDGVPRLDTLWHWRENIDINRGNLRLDNEDVATKEVSALRDYGIGTLLDLTSVGLGGNIRAVERVSVATGLNIVAGTGYYTGGSQSPEVLCTSEDDMVNRIVRDIEEGIDGTGICAGVIGEVGVSWPLKAFEERSLAASVRAMKHTGAAMSIHLPFHLSDVGIL
jgi:phosphotriesterase-related protein